MTAPAEDLATSVGPFVARRLTRDEYNNTARDLLGIDTAPANIHSWGRIPLAKFPELEAYIHAHYQLVGQPAGAAVYRRR